MAIPLLPWRAETMARISIELPERFAFATEIELMMPYINFGGHLDNAMMLSVVSDARIRYLEVHGHQPRVDGGIGMIVGDVAAEYRSEGFHREVMVVEMTARDFHKYGCDIVWRMTEKNTGREVARGKTGVLAFDRTSKKLTQIPEDLLQSLQTS